MSRQVEYATKIFDLRSARETLNFVLQLFNFVQVAIEDNGTLRDPQQKVGALKSQVKAMKLKALTKRKAEGGTEDERPAKKPKTGDEAVNSGILSDAAIMEKVECAGYTIPPEDEIFESLLPVSVSFP
jgi:hypothetical protein